ncbi:MAG: phosphotransferase [Planctomycetes bacterium]|nr:phosphotransferase [Planctomycetota bacterium]
MPRGGAHFSSAELAEALSHYEIGTISGTKSLSAGDRGAPKKIITTDRGRFLLKRRSKRNDDSYHVAFSHSIHTYLDQKDFPVASLIPTDKHGHTALYLDGHAYELFEFIDGSRFDGSAGCVSDSGRQLALFHLNLLDFECDWQPLRRTYHDSSAVRGHLKTIGSAKNAAGSNRKIRATAQKLLTDYNHSSVHVNELGFDSWPEQIVHGDWHPGNMLFCPQGVAAVLDFDSVKVAPCVTDAANGALHYSIVGGRPNPAQWPAYLDLSKLANFLASYGKLITLHEDMLGAIGDLMIEIMIAEAVMPIAVTGFFGHLPGPDFLEMIRRKCEWIDDNRDPVRQAVFQ